MKKSFTVSNFLGARRRWLIVTSLVLVSACAPEDSETAIGGPGEGGAAGVSTGTGGTGGAGGSGQGGGAASDCSAYKGLATPAEIALSPMANVEAEQLAMEATGALVAPAGVYDRIGSDLKAIRAGYPEVGGGATPSWVPNHLIVGMDEHGLAAVKAGSYTDWKCPNELYGVKSIDVHTFSVILELNAHLFIPLLQGEYASLPHVKYAEPNGFISSSGGDLCAAIDSATYSYIFKVGSGDCQAGCIDRTYWGFSTDANGTITVIGTWSTPDPPPPWFMALAKCTQWI